jgi:hypothetical protein
MTEQTLKDPVKNILVKGVETPRVIDNGDGTVTWNLKQETSIKIASLLLASMIGSMAKGGRGASSGGLGDLLGGRGF